MCSKERLEERIEALPYKQTNRQPGARHHGLCFRRLWKNFGLFLGPEPHHHRARILQCLDLGVSINDQEDEPMRAGHDLTLQRLQHRQMRVQELTSRHRSAGRWYCLTDHMIKPYLEEVAKQVYTGLEMSWVPSNSAEAGRLKKFTVILRAPFLNWSTFKRSPSKSLNHIQYFTSNK